ncbi:hypothetical protein NQ011_05005 [Corynebacterium phoceense]|uniref:hypothetical protein n=1 Tax=Corynebacterium phoceense TaxID=1686286 RepID=UPI00211C06EA|nr:hypothetical protein [Corynebacterium phoceense]MCQ9336043.1 hypothetical protein [Corynebacterium phoceense]
MKADTRRALIFIVVGVLLAAGIGAVVWRLGAPGPFSSNTAMNEAVGARDIDLRNTEVPGDNVHDHVYATETGESSKSGRNVAPLADDPFLAPNAVFNTKKLDSSPTTYYRPGNIGDGTVLPTATRGPSARTQIPATMAPGATAALTTVITAVTGDLHPGAPTSIGTLPTNTPAPAPSPRDSTSTSDDPGPAPTQAPTSQQPTPRPTIVIPTDKPTEGPTRDEDTPASSTDETTPVEPTETTSAHDTPATATNGHTSPATTTNGHTSPANEPTSADSPQPTADSPTAETTGVQTTTQADPQEPTELAN